MLEFYGDIYTKSGMEGRGYYVTDYESADTFIRDPELKNAFEKYNVNKNKLLRYAARRDQRKEIEQLMQKINNE